MVLYYSKIPYTALYCNIIYYRNYNNCYCITIQLYCIVIQYNMYYNSIVLYCDTVQIVALGIYPGTVTEPEYITGATITYQVLYYHGIVLQYNTIYSLVL